MKRCSKCGETKSIDCFGANKSEKDGLSYYCKECKREKDRKYVSEHKKEALVRHAKWRANNPEHVKLYSRARYAKNKNKINEQARKRRWENRDKNNEYFRQYYKKNAVKKRMQRRVWYLKNIESLRVWHKNYREANREKIRTRYRAWSKRQMIENPHYRIRRSLGERIRQVLKGIKSARTRELIGCNEESLKSWLEAKFLPGMSWSNYGEWHVDHIKPVSSFDLQKPEEQKICFHYTNLQPLWARDNLLKGAKL